jgi:hypothetical protein
MLEGYMPDHSVARRQPYGRPMIDVKGQVSLSAELAQLAF